MKIVLVRVGRGRTAWADAAWRDYTRRLPRQVPVSETLLRPEPFHGDPATVRAAESGRIVGTLGEGDRLVLLDERGELMDSQGFADLISHAARLGCRRLIFAIGGPYGHGPAARERAWKVLALSPMVLNHEVARVVLAEQLYRASTLLWGGSYHH